MCFDRLSTFAAWRPSRKCETPMQNASSSCASAVKFDCRYLIGLEPGMPSDFEARATVPRRVQGGVRTNRRGKGSRVQRAG